MTAFLFLGTGETHKITMMEQYVYRNLDTNHTKHPLFQQAATALQTDI